METHFYKTRASMTGMFLTRLEDSLIWWIQASLEGRGELIWPRQGEKTERTRADRPWQLEKSFGQLHSAFPKGTTKIHNISDSRHVFATGWFCT